MKAFNTMPAPKELKQISDVTWELPVSFKKGMLVPGLIFGTKNIIEQMDDQVYEQLANVCALPGIVKHGMCMPDGHSGYGFPIGGVAAFDPEKGGVISPGGIGFDINCLTPETKILTSYGYYKQIKDFEDTFTQDALVSIDTKNLTKITSNPALFLRKPADKRMLRITTIFGEEITLSEDHPLYTGREWVPAGLLQRSDRIVTHPFSGVEFESFQEDSIILTEDDIRAVVGDRQKIIDLLHELDLLPLTTRSKKLPLLAKLVGFITGDGWVGSYHSSKRQQDVWSTRIIGKRVDLEEVQQDIQRLGYGCNSIHTKSYTSTITSSDGQQRVIDGESTQLCVNSQSLSVLLHALGVPKGNKSRTPTRVPQWVLESPLWIKRLYLAGLFGAELTRPMQRKGEERTFTEPSFSQNKVDSLERENLNFLLQITNLLLDFGIVVNKIYKQKGIVNTRGEHTHKLALRISSKPENLIRLWGTVGYEFCQDRRQLSMLALSYLKYKQHYLGHIRDFITQARQKIDSGATRTEIYHSAGEQGISVAMIKGQLQRASSEIRAPESFPTFEEFKDYAELIGSELINDEIEEITEIPYEGDVYDFTMGDEHHNFIANSIVSHNCGMRLLTTNLTLKDVQPKLKELVDELFKQVPAGVGSSGFVKLDRKELEQVMIKGAKWAVEKGYGWPEDLERIEDFGAISWADPKCVSDRAVKRGCEQLGTLGSGNHYLEIQVAKKENIFDAELAKAMGIVKDDQILVMVHCGSRGFGHQIGTDYLKIFIDVMKRENIEILDRELACAPFKSKEGQDYFKAMACAANLAFANRQVILHRIRGAFEKVFKQDAKSLGMHMVYDVAHNIAKLEKHMVDGKMKELLVHRKGSTRAFGPGREELGPLYRKIGQPVIVGGSMETGSYLLVGTKKGEEVTWGSTMHGSGRTMSRTQARRDIKGEKLQQDMLKKGIYVHAVSMSGLAEEAGEAYKDIDEVVGTMEKAGVTKPVVALKPCGNVKG